jgi:RNA polymerase sigma-70 factor, ECF subfamily
VTYVAVTLQHRYNNTSVPYPVSIPKPTRSYKKATLIPSTRDSSRRDDSMDADQLLIRRAIDGDERALRQLWSQHAPRIDAVVKRLAGDADLAADIAQDVWIQIFRALKTYRGDAQFGTWAHRIAVNRTLNALRKVRRLAKVELDIEEDSVSVEMDPDRAFLAASIDEAARKLPEGARTVFLLHDVEGYTHEDIARELGITPGASKSQLFKARAKLRRLLAHLVDHLPATDRAHVAPAS